MNDEQLADLKSRKVAWQAASERFYRGDFLHRSWVADAIADADVLIDTIDALREENTKLREALIEIGNGIIESMRKRRGEDQ